jgi:hypothetical protein
MVTPRRGWVPRPCTICVHPEREAIDRALVEGVPNRRIASHHDVTERAVRNHKATHLPTSLAKAQVAEEVAQADDLLDQLQDLQRRTLAILEAAEETREHRTALSAIREARSNLELLAKLLGELDARPQVNVLISPEWLELRAVIVGALEPHPQALRAVVGALESGGNGRA